MLREIRCHVNFRVIVKDLSAYEAETLVEETVRLIFDNLSGTSRFKTASQIVGKQNVLSSSVEAFHTNHNEALSND